jgi:hypothetical protein
MNISNPSRQYTVYIQKWWEYTHIYILQLGRIHEH